MTTGSKPTIPVNFVFRKPQQAYYSVERVFLDVKKQLPPHIRHADVYLPYYSRGIADRIRNIFFCRRLTGNINHITGDVNYLAAFMPERSTVLTVLDCVYQFNTSGLKRWFIWFFWYYLPVRRCRYITAISEFSRQETLRVTGVPASRIEVIHVALPEGFVPVPKTFRTDKPAILHVGNTPNKNLNTLIRALEGVSCELWVVGKLTEENLHLLEACRVTYVSHTGIDDAALIELYRRCDIVSFISLYEGFGMPVIEGQATGRPVVTSNRGSLPEVAGDAALIVHEPENPEAVRKAIRELITNPALRESLVAKGYENVKRFDGKKLAQQYADLYQRMQNEGQPA